MMSDPTLNGSSEVQLARISERLDNLNTAYLAFRSDVHEDLHQLRQQTHEWLQVMVNKLPTWAVAVGGFMTTAIGAMAMWIITHKQ